MNRGVKQMAFTNFSSMMTLAPVRLYYLATSQGAVFGRLKMTLLQRESIYWLYL